MTNNKLFNESDGFLGMSPPLASLISYSFYANLDLCIATYNTGDCNQLSPNNPTTLTNNIKSLMLTFDQMIDPETNEQYL